MQTTNKPMQTLPCILEAGVELEFDDASASMELKGQNKLQVFNKVSRRRRANGGN